MKKYLKILICALVVVTLTGCGSSNNSDADTKGSSSSVTKKTTTQVTESKLETFVNESRADVQKLSNSLFEADLIARDNSVVYVYTYKKAYDKSVLPTMKDSLETSINSQSSVFDSVLKYARLAEPTTKSVIVEYYNGDGSLIAKIEFE